MKVIVLTWGGLQGMLPSSHGSKPCRKAAVELAEVSTTHTFVFPIRARSILTLFGDKIDRLRSFLPFWEAKFEKKRHFHLLFGYKNGRKRRESRKK